MIAVLMASLALIAGGIVAGALVIDYGVKSMRTVFAGQNLDPLGGALSPAGGSGAVGKVKPSDLQSVGAQHGWKGSQLTDWMNLIGAESGGDPNAVNPNSGAAGIAQFIRGFGEYAAYGGNRSSVIGQLVAMANYIAQRYGNPSAAWQFHLANGYY